MAELNLMEINFQPKSLKKVMNSLSLKSKFTGFYEKGV